jgi:hypothetical protein
LGAAAPERRAHSGRLVGPDLVEQTEQMQMTRHGQLRETLCYIGKYFLMASILGTAIIIVLVVIGSQV